MAGVAGHVVVGTMPYLSPEALSHERANPTFDLWALAVVFYQSLTGRRPFETTLDCDVAVAIKKGQWTRIETHLPVCSANLRSFFVDALSLNPLDRPRTASQLAQRLRRLRA